MPVYAGRLVDAVALGAASDAAIWKRPWPRSRRSLRSAGAIVLRHLAFIGIIDLTLRMMSDVAADAFHRVQRFSTDWHANSFAGSTVRKITRGMWALDLLNDTLLVALLPSLVVLVGSTVLLALLLAGDGPRSWSSARSSTSRMTVALSLALCRAGGAACQPVGHAARRRAGRRGQLQRRGEGVRRGGARGRALRQRRRQVAEAARGGPGCAAPSTARRRAPPAGAARRGHRHGAAGSGGTGRRRPAT